MPIDLLRKEPLTLARICGSLLLIFVGSLLCAVAVNGILIPQGFVSGGVTGLAIIINTVFPDIHTALAYALINVPLFIVAWMEVGRRFFSFSIAGLLSLVAALYYVHIPVPVEDKILSALLAGILTGAGAGVTLRSLGSQGGLDILSIILLRRYSIGIGSTTLIMNAVVLGLVVLIYSLEAVLYSLIVFYVGTKILDLVVTGFNQRKALFIISGKYEEIAREILKNVSLGVTVLQGQGGYSGEKEEVLYTVIPFRYLGEIKRLILRIDPKAFIVVSDTREVVNFRIGNQPHW